MKLKLWILLIIVGIACSLSMLLSDIPLGSLPEELISMFTPLQVRLLLLINPIILTLVFVTIGTLVHQTAGYSLPVFSGMISGEMPATSLLKRITLSGVVSGIVAGLMIVLTGSIFKSHLPEAFNEAAREMQLNVVTRFLYGGVVEELMMRFGLMSLLTWILIKVAGKPLNIFHWVAILISSFVFALGHFPLMFQMVPDPGGSLIAYILIGNMAGGLVFGFTYWRNGLESAIIAHIFAHVVMIAAELIAH
jgi:membrane protease YdiL (CAAX protease family)